jgi:hypothetical protein
MPSLPTGKAGFDGNSAGQRALAITIITLYHADVRMTSAYWRHRAVPHKQWGRKHMSDTIELLEVIGRDASLRYASAEDLVRALEQAQASDALAAAAVSGDISELVAELGPKPMNVPQISQAPAREDDEEQEEDDIDEPLNIRVLDRDDSFPRH